MKIEDARGKYYECTETLSDLITQFGLAGIAVIWVFKPKDSLIGLDPKLVLAGILLLCSLSLHFLQYYINSLIWGLFSRHHEKIKTEPRVHKCMNWPAIICFQCKTLSLIVAYLCLFMYLGAQFKVAKQEAIAPKSPSPTREIWLQQGR